MVRLDRFDNRWYDCGRSLLVQSLWYFGGLAVLRCNWMPSSMVRRWLLRVFGAQIGRGVVLKPGLRVKYPWHFTVGDYAWVGEDVWIDNHTTVAIGSHSCISQGAYLGTGNHDWSDTNFGLILKPISIGSGAWVGAKAVICPGVVLHEGSVVTAGSVATKSVPAFEIFTGNPATFSKKRVIRRSNERPSIKRAL